MTDLSSLPDATPDVDELPLALQVEPVAGLDELGPAPELHELNCWELHRVMRAAPDGEADAALLGASLWVDGRPLGLARALRLPGHLYIPVREALNRCAELHGMHRRTPAAASSAAPPPGEA